ncbi:MAG: hypothetical protein AAGB04_00740 [Pseudomonadota bacterium]
MTTLSLKGYYTKSQLSQRHGRHTRTLGKDISGAVSRRDQELLALLRLQVSPGGQVLEGAKVTSAKVKQLKTKSTLTWYAKDEFVERVLQRKPQRRLKEEASTPKYQPPVDSAAKSEQSEAPTSAANVDNIIAALPADAAEKARMLEQLYRQASTELVQARAISADFKAVFGDFKEVVNKQADGQQQNNKLLNDLIQEVRDRGMLGAGSEEPESTAQGREVVDAVTVDESATAAKAKEVTAKATESIVKEAETFGDSVTNSWQPNSLASRWLPTFAKRIDRLTRFRS